MVEDVSDSGTCELDLAEALAHVPGYRPGDPSIKISRLSGGSVNRSYSVSTRLGRFVLRLSQGPDAWLTSDRSVERELHRIASAAALAPPIVEATDRWLITEYVHGRLWVEPDFANPERLARLGDTLRRLHQLPAPERGRFDLLEALEGYVTRIGDEAGSLADYPDNAAAAWRVSGATQRPLAILHHDLHASNLIENERELVLVDWECAAVSDPLLDVACVLSYHECARAHTRLLLQHAGLEGVTAQQVAASVWLFDLHTYLWYRERRLRRSPTQVELEAERLLAERLPHTLRDWQSGAT
jgi:aminoglycoside phosphotransferase (APT) family kinase protein